MSFAKHVVRSDEADSTDKVLRMLRASRGRLDDSRVADILGLRQEFLAGLDLDKQVARLLRDIGFVYGVDVTLTLREDG